MGKNHCDFNSGMAVGARLGGLSISQKPILLTSWEFHTQRHLSIHRMVQRKNKINSNKPSAWGLICRLNILLLEAIRGERPDQAELKGSIVTIVTQISTLYKRGEQKAPQNSEYISNLKTTSESTPDSQEQWSVALTMALNNGTHQNWTVENWKK